MRFLQSILAAVVATPLAVSVAWGDMEAQQGTGKAGAWAPRIPVKPDPSKIVVPPGYKVGVLVAGLDTPSAATVDGDGNVWVAISGNLFGGPDGSKIEPPHVKVFDKSGKLLKEIGKGVFKA